MEKYVDYAVEKAMALLAVDSPSGFTDKAASFVKKEFEALGFQSILTQKGGVLVDLGGEGEGLALMAHTDTLGCMVAEIKGNGRLRLTNLGGLHAAGTEGENVTLYTRDGRTYEGTLQMLNPSVHVNDDWSKVERNWNTVECVLDEDVQSKEATKALGIEVGDIVCLDPKSRVTEKGYIKSRFLDDKLSVGILLGFAKMVKDGVVSLKRRTYLHITVYEEVGHGGSGSLPEGITEAISVDMGCVGDGIQCTEKQVSICAKDSGGPYSYEVVSKLLLAAKKEGADYAVDVYPHYGSDVEATLRAGFDIKHGLIGPGVFASHCYERSHKDGVKHTLLVLKGYVTL